MDQKLIDVSKTGDIDAFYALLGEDQYILEGIDIAPFVDTPLHIAIVSKKTDFAVEIANLKPSFARKLNQAGFSPIHLASTDGNLRIVHELLDKDHDLCLLAGRGKRIPLHCAAEAGKVDVMKALLKDCPNSIGMLTVYKETPLHLAAKNGQVEACKVLLDSMVELNRWRRMNWKYGNGKTVLDAASGSPEVMDLLANEYHNLERKALEMESSGFMKVWMEKQIITNDTRNAMLVVLALIITTLFQAVVSPPGGVWQDTTTYSNNSNINANTTAGSQPAHEAGTAVMGDRYGFFADINTFGFCASIAGIILLTHDIPLLFQFLLISCIGSMMGIYSNSIGIISMGSKFNWHHLYISFSSVANSLTVLFIGVTIFVRFHISIYP